MKTTRSYLLCWSSFMLLLLCLFGFAKPTDQILSIHRTRRSLVVLPQNESFQTKSEKYEPKPLEDNNPSSAVKINFKNSEVSRISDIDDNDKHKDTNNNYTRSKACMLALLSAGVVGLSGILPLLILPNIKDGKALKEGAGAKQLKRLLSFAVGGLLGDVFLHLLPESWDHLQKHNDGLHDHWPMVINGLWILVGLISFCVLEKLFPDGEEAAINMELVHDMPDSSECNGCNLNRNNNNHQIVFNGMLTSQNGCSLNEMRQNKIGADIATTKTNQKVKTSGYLNLLANCIDNFTHGLAVGGSYLVSERVGILTTLAILLHEIPHEVGDFAILIRAGFSRWQAAKLQILTASGGLIGATFALIAESAKVAGDQVAWILPFTSGGFIYVALCTVVPDIMKEASPRESMIQVLFIILAISVMHAVSYVG